MHLSDPHYALLGRNQMRRWQRMKKNLTIICREEVLSPETPFLTCQKPHLKPDSFSMSHSLTRKLVLLPMIILAKNFYSLILMHSVSSPSESTTHY